MLLQSSQRMIAAPSRSAFPSLRAVVHHGLLGRKQLRSATRVAYSTSSHSHFTEYTLTTEDRLEIIDLCHKFDHALNLGQQDKLGDFFAPDAQVITPLGAVQGVDPIVDYFHKCRPMAAGNRHLTCDILVEADGVNSAKATAYRLLHKCCCPPVLLASGLIEDKLVNINGEWRFAERIFTMDPPAQQQPAAGANGVAKNVQN